MNTKKLLNDYYNWLKENYTVNHLEDDSDEIVTPFLDSLNDNICIYTETLKNGNIQLTDDGYTLNNLRLMGVDITQFRSQIISNVRKQYKVDLIGDILSISGPPSEFPIMKFRLMSAIIKIEDINFTKKDNVISLFRDEVINYLVANDFGGIKEHTLNGSSGIAYKLPYIIPKHKKRPARIFETTGTLSKSIMMQHAYERNDLRRIDDLQNSDYYLITRSNTPISESVKKIAKDTGIKTLSWNIKDEIDMLKI